MLYQTFSFWGVACFNYVLVTNSNPVTTCTSDGQVNPYPYTTPHPTEYINPTWGQLILFLLKSEIIPVLILNFVRWT